MGAAVREAIAEGVVTRDQVHVTSKLSPYELGAPRAAAACAALLERLGLGYVDLVLVHWPGAARQPPASPAHATARRETWRVLEDFHRAGAFREIGVSNFERRHLEELLAYCHVRPAANQVECHPRWPQTQLRQFCLEAGVAVIAYGSFGAGALLAPGAAPELDAVAARAGATPAQLLLRWGLQKGCHVIPKSVRLDRVAEFCEVAAAAAAGGETRYLSVEDEALLDSMGEPLDRRKKYCWDPAGVA